MSSIEVSRTTSRSVCGPAGSMSRRSPGGAASAGATASGPSPTKSLRTFADRKSTRLNSSHGYISYAVFCLKKKKNTYPHPSARHTPPTTNTPHTHSPYRHPHTPTAHDSPTCDYRTPEPPGVRVHDRHHTYL